VERRYGRAQFLRDALALGLPVRQAFSRTALRRQRDVLMRLHHPDRGGSDDRAREINEIYARMIRWLDGRNRAPGRQAPSASDGVIDHDAGEGDSPQKKLLRKAVKAALWAMTAAATSYLATRKARRR
jgi:hypothetical protein